ncbi:MAG: EamA family transporter [Candidatus Nanohalobium sp.]
MIELGILLALGVAVVKGFQSVYERENVLDTDEYVTAWSSRFFALPFLLVFLAFQGVPALSTDVLFYLIPQGLLITFTSVLIAKAFKESDASIVTPMFALSPILVVGTSFLMLGETPSPEGIIGILLITLGAYILKIQESTHVLDPLRKLWKERGVQLILVVILIYSVTANIDKIGVTRSSAVFWTLSIHFTASMLLLPIMIGKSSDWKSKVKNKWQELGFLGSLGGISSLLQMTALKLTLVSYVIAIKRLSIPIAVIFSFFMLKEKESFSERMAGSALMVIGAILITL